MADCDDEHSALLYHGEQHSNSVFARYIHPCLAEFTAVTIFVFIGTMATVDLATIEVATAHGLTIAILVACFAPISGAHINPAVTLGVALGGGMDKVLVVPYILSQLIGGILGAALTQGVLDYVDPSTGTNAYVSVSAGGHSLSPGVSDGEGILCEMMLTFFLVMAVLMMAVDRHHDALAPIVIGLVVLVDILAGGRISGASMNPARSFGPAVVSSGYDQIDLWTDQWIYWVGPLLGCILAACVYRFALANNEKRIICKTD